MTRFWIVALLSISFAVTQWGSRDVRFGLALAMVAFVAFLAGQSWERRR